MDLNDEEEEKQKRISKSKKADNREDYYKDLCDPSYHFPSGLGEREDDYGDESYP